MSLPNAVNAVETVPLVNSTALRSYTITLNQTLGPQPPTRMTPSQMVNSGAGLVGLSSGQPVHCQPCVDSVCRDELQHPVDSSGQPQAVLNLPAGYLPPVVVSPCGYPLGPTHTYTHARTHPYTQDSLLGANVLEQRRLTDVGTSGVGSNVAMFSCLREGGQAMTPTVNMHGLSGNPSCPLTAPKIISESQSKMAFDNHVSEVLLSGLPPPPLGAVAPTAVDPVAGRPGLGSSSTLLDANVPMGTATSSVASTTSLPGPSPVATVIGASPATTSVAGTSSVQPPSSVAGVTGALPSTSVDGTSAPSTTAATASTSATTVSSATTTTTAAVTTPSVAVTSSSTTTPVVVVRQLQAVRPYSGSTSWKLFRDHFGRVAKVNAWTTDEDLVQHLTLALEGPAAEVLRDFDDTSSTALAELWSRLEHRFGEVDSCRDAMRKFEARRQSDSESIVEFEQALRILHKEAWPSATADQRDVALKRRFEDGVASTELSQYLRLHHRDSDFAQTVQKGRIYHSTMDIGKKKAVRFVADDSVSRVVASQQDLLPLINHLKGIEGRLDKLVKAEKPAVKCVTPSPTASPTPSSRPQSPSPPQPQQNWRPRGTFNNNAPSSFGTPRFGQRTSSFQPRMPFTPPQPPPQQPPPPPPPTSPRPGCGQFRFRPPGSRGPGRCLACGVQGCHSDRHLPDGTVLSSRSSGCFVCGRFGCHSINRSAQGHWQPPRPASTPPSFSPPTQSTGNGPRSPMSGRPSSATADPPAVSLGEGPALDCRLTAKSRWGVTPRPRL